MEKGRRLARHLVSQRSKEGDSYFVDGKWTCCWIALCWLLQQLLAVCDFVGSCAVTQAHATATGNGACSQSRQVSHVVLVCFSLAIPEPAREWLATTRRKVAPGLLSPQGRDAAGRFTNEWTHCEKRGGKEGLFFPAKSICLISCITYTHNLALIPIIRRYNNSYNKSTGNASGKECFVTRKALVYSTKP